MTKQEEKKVTIRPLGNRVLVQRIEQEETLKGGIILPDSAKKKQEAAKVVALGTGEADKATGCSTCSFPVKIGDTVLIDKYAGQEVTVDDETYIIAKVEDILAVLKS